MIKLFNKKAIYPSKITTKKEQNFNFFVIISVFFAFMFLVNSISVIVNQIPPPKFVVLSNEYSRNAGEHDEQIARAYNLQNYSACQKIREETRTGGAKGSVNRGPCDNISEDTRIQRQTLIETIREADAAEDSVYYSWISSRFSGGQFIFSILGSAATIFAVIAAWMAANAAKETVLISQSNTRPWLKFEGLPIFHFTPPSQTGEGGKVSIEIDCKNVGQSPAILVEPVGIAVEIGKQKDLRQFYLNGCLKDIVGSGVVFPGENWKASIFLEIEQSAIIPGPHPSVEILLIVRYFVPGAEEPSQVKKTPVFLQCELVGRKAVSPTGQIDPSLLKAGEVKLSLVEHAGIFPT